MRRENVTYIAYCTTCLWKPAAGKSPYRAAHDHTRQTGHMTIIKRIDVRQYEPDKVLA